MSFFVTVAVAGVRCREICAMSKSSRVPELAQSSLRNAALLINSQQVEPHSTRSIFGAQVGKLDWLFSLVCFAAPQCWSAVVGGKHTLINTNQPHCTHTLKYNFG